ncbi:MAG: hypothetical protein QXV75_07780 [Candidatus Bathyarchaeia archaeon]
MAKLGLLRASFTYNLDWLFSPDGTSLADDVDFLSEAKGLGALTCPTLMAAIWQP